MDAQFHKKVCISENKIHHIDGDDFYKCHRISTLVYATELYWDEHPRQKLGTQRKGSSVIHQKPSREEERPHVSGIINGRQTYQPRKMTELECNSELLSRTSKPK